MDLYRELLSNSLLLSVTPYTCNVRITCFIALVCLWSTPALALVLVTARKWTANGNSGMWKVRKHSFNSIYKCVVSSNNNLRLQRTARYGWLHALTRISNMHWHVAAVYTSASFVLSPSKHNANGMLANKLNDAIGLINYDFIIVVTTYSVGRCVEHWEFTWIHQPIPRCLRLRISAAYCVSSNEQQISNSRK